MTEPAFKRMLVHEAIIKRPVQSKTGDKNLPVTTYVAVYADEKACRIVPAGGNTEDGLLGRFPAATHVMYCEPWDIKPNYRIERLIGATELAQGAYAGDSYILVADASGIQLGALVELSDGTNTDALQVVSLAGRSLTVEPPLSYDFSVGDTVVWRTRYDVLGVEDESGAGHHLRVALRKVEV